jgi:hypothetical protein
VKLHQNALRAWDDALAALVELREGALKRALRPPDPMRDNT